MDQGVCGPDPCTHPPIVLARGRHSYHPDIAVYARVCVCECICVCVCVYVCVFVVCLATRVCVYINTKVIYTQAPSHSVASVTSSRYELDRWGRDAVRW